jgi:hypothetical protein
MIYVVFDLYTLFCVAFDVRRWRLALSIGLNRVDFYLRTETESSLRIVIFNKKLDDG